MGDMILNLFLLWFTIAFAWQIGVRIALTNVKTEYFLIFILLVWIILKQ